MKTRYRLVRRGNRQRAFYCFDTLTGKRTSLHTGDREAARQLIEAKNIAARQPAMNLQLAQVYLQHSDAGMAARTMDHDQEKIIATNTGAAQQHRERARLAISEPIRG